METAVGAAAALVLALHRLRPASPNVSGMPLEQLAVPTPSEPSAERLECPLRADRLLYRSGLRMEEARAACREGRVTLLGEPLAAHSLVDPAGTVLLDGEKVVQKAPQRYMMMHKPTGYVTAMKDEYGRPCVGDLVGWGEAQGGHVGRLDKDTSGLLLFTDDGELLTHLTARGHFWKEYVAEVKGVVTEESLERMRAGMTLSGKGDDIETLPARVTVLDIDNKGGARIQVEVQAGQYRLVRRMLGACKLKVRTLHRAGFGPLRLGTLKVGELRHLEQWEVDQLWELAGGRGAGEAEEQLLERVARGFVSDREKELVARFLKQSGSKEVGLSDQVVECSGEGEECEAAFLSLDRGSECSGKSEDTILSFMANMSIGS